MQKLSFILIIILLSAIFITEGFGFPGLRPITYYLILVLAGLALLSSFFLKQRINVPRKIGLLVFFFLVLTLLSHIFSVNLEKSVLSFFLYFSAFSLFLYAYNNQKKLKQVFPIFLIVIAFALATYSLWLNYQMLSLINFRYLMPNDGFNLVYSTYAKHNHLGDFLLLILVANFYFLLAGKYRLANIILIIVFLPQFMLSYSRSAYSALAISMVVMLIFYLRKKRKGESRIRQYFLILVLLLVSLTSLFYAFSLTKNVQNQSFIQHVRQYYPENIKQVSKVTLNGRDQYWQEAFTSIKERPLFGLGLGNFFNASTRHTPTPFEWVRTSLNMFLTVFTETGVIAGLVFMLIILQLLLRAKKNSLYFYLWLALLINFMTDYTYAIYSMFILFFILAGLMLKNNKDLTIKPKALLIAGTVPVFLLLAISLHNIFLRMDKSTLALAVYPFKKTPYEKLIVKNMATQKYGNVFFLLKAYEYMYKGNTSVLVSIANLHLSLGNKDVALQKLKKAYYWHPFEGVDLYRRIYYLEKELNGTKNANSFVKLHTQKIQQLKEHYRTEIVKEDLKKFCQLKKLSCNNH